MSKERKLNKSILSNYSKTEDVEVQSNCQLKRANSIQLECSKVGFDWPNVAPVFDKVTEELNEVKEAIANNNKNKDDVEEELGDLLFACVNVCRHLNVSPENALYIANQKFVRRFQQIELHLHAQGKKVEHQNSEYLESLWLLAKTKAS